MNSELLHLRTTGYLLCKSVLTAVAITDLMAAVRTRPAEAVTRNPPATERYDEEAAAVMQGLLAHEGIRDLATRVLGHNWVSVQNRHNHVVIDRGAGSRAARIHRDLLHWTRAPLTFLVMLESGLGHAESWPIVVPGSHLWPISGPSNGGGYWLDESEEASLASQALSVPMSAGDVLIMDGFLFHAAGVGHPAAPRVMATLSLRTPDELERTGIAPNERLVAGVHEYHGRQERAHHD
jgi:hypothetical protein